MQDADGNDITTDSDTTYSAVIGDETVTGTASEILSAVIAAEMTEGNIELTRVSDPITVDIDYTAASATLTADDVDSAAGVANAATFGDDLTSYYEGDYTVDTITLVETRRTDITE